MLIKDHTTAPMGEPSGFHGALPLFWWQGWSNRWYITTVYPISQLDCRERGAFVLVRREWDDTMTPLMLGVARNVADDLFDLHGDATLRAIAAGATEAHVHLAADHAFQDEMMARDIARAWGLSPERRLTYA